MRLFRWYRGFRVRQARAQLAHDKRVLQTRIVQEGKETTRDHAEAEGLRNGAMTDFKETE